MLHMDFLSFFKKIYLFYMLICSYFETFKKKYLLLFLNYYYYMSKTDKKTKQTNNNKKKSCCNILQKSKLNIFGQYLML